MNNKGKLTTPNNLLRIIRLSHPSTMASTMAHTQPMSSPSSPIFYMKYWFNIIFNERLKINGKEYQI